MKLVDVYNEYKTKYNEYVILIEIGIFVNVYNSDTAIINKLLNYKIKDIGDTYLIGFPSSVLNKVLDILRQNKINYLVLGKDVNGSYIINDKYKANKNNYNKLVDDYKKLEYLHKRIAYINSKLLEKVMTDDIENILVKIEKII